MVQNKKRIISLILMLTLLVSSLVVGAITASAEDTTIKVTGNTGKLNGSTSISWTSGNYSVVNYKNTSSTAIRTSDSDHFRLYVGNKFTISGGAMSKVVITCTGSSYLTSATKNTVNDGWTVSTSGTTVTYTATSGSLSELTITIGVQSRITSVVITPADSSSGGSTTDPETPVEPDVPETTDGEWKLVTDASTLKAGDQIVIVASGSNHALGADKGNNRNAANITTSSDKSTVTINSDVQIITLENGTVDGTFAFNVGNGYLYAASSGSNYLKTSANLTNNASWLITISSNGVATIKAQGNYTRNWIRKNSSSALFSCYSSGQSDVSIYKLIEAAVEPEQPDAPEVCDHDYVGVQTKAPTCIATGVMTYTCTKDASHTYTEPIPATGHTEVVDKAVAATCIATGLTEGKHCSVCNTVIVAQEETPMTTTHSYDNHTCTVCGSKQPFAFYYVNGEAYGKTTGYFDKDNKIKLPELESSIPSHLKYSYTFVGWAKVTMSEDSNTMPTVYAGSETVEITENTNFYAVFSYSIGGAIQENNDYVLTDITDIKANDEVIIVMKVVDKYYALPTVSKPDVTEVKISSEKIAEGVADNLLWNIVPTEGGYIIYINGKTDQWLYCINDNDGVRVGNETGNNVFTLNGNYLKNISLGRYLGVYNKQDWRCYTNTSGNINNQSVAFYIKSSGSDLKFTTTLVYCTHEYDDCVDTVCNNENCNFERVAPGHAYDNACDATCNVCSATREIEGHTPVFNRYAVVDGVLCASKVCGNCEGVENTPVVANTVVEVKNEADLKTVLYAGYSVKLTANINLTSSINLNGDIDVTIDLNGYTVDACYEAEKVEVVLAQNGAQLTVKDSTNGNGAMIATGNGDYVEVISSIDGAIVTIENGEFISDGCTAIYATRGGKVVINGGYYEAKELYNGMRFLLDVNEAEEIFGEIVVTGGTFVNFNPANHNNDGKGYTNKVAPGYITTKDADGNYVVSEFKAPTDPTEKVTISNPFTLAEDVILNGELVIKNGAVIDLNGCTIESSSVITFNGTIIDTVGTGKIIVNVDSETNKPMLQITKGNYDYAPIHIETKDGKSTYAITPVKVQTATAELSNTAVVRPSLKGNVYTNKAIFAGELNHGITFELLVTRTKDGVSEDAYVSLDNIDLTQLYADNQHAIKITLKGGLEGYTYTVKLVVKSAGVQVHVSDVIATLTVPVTSTTEEEGEGETTND